MVIFISRIKTCLTSLNFYLPQKMTFESKVVKSDLKMITSFCISKYATRCVKFVEFAFVIMCGCQRCIILSALCWLLATFSFQTNRHIHTLTLSRTHTCTHTRVREMVFLKRWLFFMCFCHRLRLHPRQLASLFFLKWRFSILTDFFFNY